MPPPVFTRTFAGRQIDLVVKHDDVADAELVEMRGLRHGAAGLVHEGAGQQQQRALAAERPSAATPWKRRRHGAMP